MPGTDANGAISDVDQSPGTDAGLGADTELESSAPADGGDVGDETESQDDGSEALDGAEDGETGEGEPGAEDDAAPGAEASEDLPTFDAGMLTNMNLALTQFMTQNGQPQHAAPPAPGAKPTAPEAEAKPLFTPEMEKLFGEDSTFAPIGPVFKGLFGAIEQQNKLIGELHKTATSRVQAAEQAEQQQAQARVKDQCDKFYDFLGSKGHAAIYGTTGKETPQQRQARGQVFEMAKGLQQMMGGPQRITAKHALSLAHQMFTQTNPSSPQNAAPHKKAADRSRMRTPAPGRGAGKKSDPTETLEGTIAEMNKIIRQF